MLAERRVGAEPRGTPPQRICSRPRGAGGSVNWAAGEGSPRARPSLRLKLARATARRAAAAPGAPAGPASRGELLGVSVACFQAGRRASPGLARPERPPSRRGPAQAPAGSRARSALAPPAPPPPGSPAPCVSTWPGRAPHPERLSPRAAPGAGRRGEGGGDPPPGWGGGAWLLAPGRLFANGPERHVQVASHSGGGGGAGDPDGTAGERGRPAGRSERPHSRALRPPLPL